MAYLSSFLNGGEVGRRLEKVTAAEAMYIAGGLLGELTGGLSFEHRYTYGAKGWGGHALVDGEWVGSDCNGGVTDGLRRLGVVGYGKLSLGWRYASASRMHELDEWREVGEAGAAPFDVIQFSGHVGLVVLPGKLYFDVGGGDRDTQPGGADWPPARGRARLREWDYAGKRILRVGRLRSDVGAGDREYNRAWLAHVVDARKGGRPPLPSGLEKYFRPAWQAPEAM